MRKAGIYIMLIFLVCVVAMGLCLWIYACDAPHRWCRELRKTIQAGNTSAAMRLIDEGIAHGYGMDTLSEPESVFWTLLEHTPKTPLEAAFRNGNYEVSQRLLQEGASVETAGGIETVLWRRYMPTDLQILEIMMEHGVDLPQSEYGWPVLDAVKRIPRVYNGASDPATGSYYNDEYDAETAEGITDVFLLLAEHTDVYVVDSAKRNALHYAALYGNWHLVQTLATQFDYPLEAEDEWGNTAYDLAVEEDAPEYILDMLKTEK